MPAAGGSSVLTAVRARLRTPRSPGVPAGRGVAELSAHPLRDPVDRARLGAPGSEPRRRRLTGQLGFGRVALLTALGLLLVAIADYGAYDSHGWAPALFWGGLAVIFVPAAIRLIGPTASPRERLAVAVMLGISLYLVKVMRDPLAFSYHDELGHYRSTEDILVTRHLFAENPIVSAYPFYPGIEMVTSMLVQLGHLSIFAAGTLVVGIARLMFMIALFLFFERVGGSSRVAGIASAIYAANPNFLFFDSQFAYESLALPLAAVSLFAVARSFTLRPVAQVLPAVAIAGLTLTHHITQLALAIFLVSWAVVELVRRRRPDHRERRLLPIAAFAAIAFGAWFTLVSANAVHDELGPVFSGLGTAVVQLFTGGLGAKHPFGAGTGATDSAIVQLLGFASVALLLVGLPIGLYKAWQRHRGERLALLVSAAALLYPLSLVPRLTQAGTEFSNRASEFLFAGSGFVMGLAIVDLRLPRWLLHRSTRLRLRLATAGFVAYATVLFLGGVSVGWPAYGRLPGPYLVGADERSVDPHGIQAARWAHAHLPARSHVLTDRVSGELLASYGREDPQAGLDPEGVPSSQVFYSPTFGLPQRNTLRGLRIHYLQVDRRLSQAPPASGHYFEQDNLRSTAISPGALSKFDSVPGLSRIFDDGTIEIFDTSTLLGKRVVGP